MQTTKAEIKVTFHDKVLFEGIVEMPLLSCDSTCVKVEFNKCVEFPNGEMGGVKFSAEQIKAIMEVLEPSKRVSWLYYVSPSDWTFEDCRKCLRYNDMHFVEN